MPASRNTVRSKTCSSPSRSSRWPINPANRDGADRLGKALARFMREDPTFRVAADEETGETLDRRDGRVASSRFTSSGSNANTRSRSKSAPRRSATARPRPPRPPTTSSTRSRPAARANIAHIVGYLEPLPDDSEEEIFEFENDVVAGPHPEGIHPLGRKGLPQFARKGADRRLPDRRRESRARRRLVSRSR